MDHAGIAHWHGTLSVPLIGPAPVTPVDQAGAAVLLLFIRDVTLTVTLGPDDKFGERCAISVPFQYACALFKFASMILAA